MLKPQLLTIFLIFCTANTFCVFNDIIEAGELLREVLERLTTINTTGISRETYPEAVDLVREFLGKLEALNNYRTPEIDQLDELNSTLKPDSLYHSTKKFPFISRIKRTITGKLLPSISEIFNVVADRFTRGSHDQCGGDKKNQNFWIEVYKMITMIQMKENVISAFANAYPYGAKGLSIGRNNSTINGDQYLLAYSYALSSILETINVPYFRFCNQRYNPWIKDISYFELNGFVQEVIFKYRRQYCHRNCWNIWNQNSCHWKWFDSRTGCNGQIISCAWLGTVEACALTQGQHKFQWVDSSEFGLQPNNSRSCPEKEGYRIQTRAEAIFSSPESSCHCHCLEKKWTIYLGRLESNASDNYVITGVRFRLKDNMLFLQPAQGKLHGNGSIANYEWVSLPAVIPAEDISNLDWDHRSFFLDDVKLDPVYVLTGIKFDAVERGNKMKIKGFAISISGLPLDYRNAKLDLTPANRRVIRVTPSGTENELVYERVRPRDTEIFQFKEPSSQEFTYITLQQSDLANDFGQSTLPSFDSTPVVMKRHSPLGGIAIFHKGSNKNAGFISVRVRPINYLPFVKELIKSYQGNATKV